MRGATVVENKYDDLFFNLGGLGVTIGSYINVGSDPDDDLIKHEYGHYLQSKAAGLLYLPKYGITSLTTESSIGFRGNHNDFWVERDADARSVAFFDRKDYKASQFKSTNPQWYEYALSPLMPFTPHYIALTLFLFNRLNQAP
jgi:hypothetical protein